MKIISMGLKGKEFEVQGYANVQTKAVKFQAVLNGVPYFESEDYEKARAMILEGLRINTKNKESAN